MMGHCQDEPLKVASGFVLPVHQTTAVSLKNNPTHSALLTPFPNSTVKHMAGNCTLTHTCFFRLISFPNNCMSHQLLSITFHIQLLTRIKAIQTYIWHYFFFFERLRKLTNLCPKWSNREAEAMENKQTILEMIINTQIPRKMFFATIDAGRNKQSNKKKNQEIWWFP